MSRVALVTGAAAGIGAAVARRLAADGLHVVGTDVRAADGCRRLDVTDAEATAALVAEIERDHGGLDVLVANAGVAAPPSALVDLPDGELRRVVEVNVFGVVNGVRAVVPAMRRRGGGRIVLMASQLGKTAWPQWAAYSGSKAFVVSLAQSLAQEHAGEGILVNAVCPGNIDTPMLRAAFARRAGDGEAGEVLAAGYARESIPVGRLGTPEDVAGAVAWLVSADAAFVAGTALNVTGAEMVF